MNVLLIDDEASLLSMLKIHLTRAGFGVVAAAGPEAGLARLEERSFDWLVVDGQMEPIDGFEVARRAKALRPGLRIVMMSGVYQTEDLAGSPVEKLFEKPFESGELIAYLRAPSAGPSS